MKIHLGKYIEWIGPYQIADTLQKVGVSEYTCYRIGEWLANGKDENNSRLFRLCDWIYSKRKRNIKLKIHDYDIWSMDSTLALIVLPMLRKLKETKHGAPNVDDGDVPEHLRSTAAGEKENEWDIDDNHFARWDYILDEMIFAFEHIDPENDWIEQFYSGECKFTYVKDEITGNSFVDSTGDFKVDQKGIKEISDRIQNGTLMFGKYFQSLWT